MARLLPFLKWIQFSSFPPPTGLYDYVQYMQMQSICIVIAYADGSICVCHTYADARHMDMLNLCCILSFPVRSEKGSSDLLSALRRAAGPATQDVAVFQLTVTLDVVSSPAP